MTRFLTSLSLAAMLAVPALAQVNIGYTNQSFNRSEGVRFGTSEMQGQAIKLTKAKLDLLRGKSITGVRAVFGTRNMSDITFFVTTDLNSTPLYTQSAADGTYNWTEYAFDTPFVIGNEDSLYIGYTLTARTAYRPLMFDGSLEMRDRCFYYTPTGWNDAYGQGVGCASLQAVVSEAAFTDAVVKDFSVSGYYQAGQPYVYTSQLLNFGTEPITSFDVVCRVGNAEAQRYSYTAQNIAHNASLDIVLPEYTSTESGDLALNISIENINGQPADADPTDNAATAGLYMYPADMQRAVLLEGFTGQACSNCPTGHAAINTALGQFDGNVIELFHHIGYQPDNFTMSEETYYINFYGTGTTFAPAFMVNRMCSATSAAPAQNVSTGAVLDMLNYCSAIQPYVGVEIISDFDEATRTVSGQVEIYTHVVPEADTTLLSLLIVQDSIAGSQIGGSGNYVHRYAYRGSLLGEYGGIVHLERGQTISIPFSYTLPDSIISTYYAGAYPDDQLPSLPTDPAQMYLVAAVGGFSAAGVVVDNPIYNATLVKMCRENVASSIASVNAAAPSLRVVGNSVVLSEPCDRIAVADMSGRIVASFADGTTQFSLPKGLYIVRATSGAATLTRKVAVGE